MKFKIILSIFLLHLTACLDISGSKNQVLQEVISPAKNKKAILFIKYTGATSDNSLQISLNKENYELQETEAGNIFTADSDHGKTQLDTSVIRFNWISEDTLVIRYDNKLRTFTRSEKFMETVIKYEQCEWSKKSKD